jgi:IclR family acetate operon transcriptional repressor
MGYVVQRGDLGFWYVGVKAFEVGSAFLSTRDLVAQSHPHLRALVEQSGETANLAVLDDGEAVIVDQVQCQEMMRMLARLGSRAPAHASAVGKAMLAWLQDREITSILHRKGLIRLCQNTIDTPSRLRVELLEVRRRGFAVDDEEHAIGLRCAAAAIHDEHAEPIAAISVSGPKPRITDARLPELGALVAQAAQAITRSIGGRTPAA